MSTTTDQPTTEQPSDSGDCSAGYQDVAHTLIEFPVFPWDRIDAEWLRDVGGYGSGGTIGGVDFDNPLRSYIRFQNDDGNCEVWEIPRNLRRLLDVRYRQGQSSVRAKLRELIAP